NCNGNHLLKDCRKPKDQARIEANRKILANMRRGNINHEEPNMVNAIQSSEIKSSEIQEVLAPDFDCFQLNVLLPPMGRATKQEGDDASCPIPFKGNCYIPQNFTFIGSTIYESIRERAVPVIKMKVNGVETKALIDSGSAISVISETLFNKLRTPFYAWFGGLLRGADGKGIKPQGITKIIVSHEKGTHEIEVVVIKGANPDLLLGNDYSRKAGLNIDFGKRIIRFASVQNRSVEVQTEEPDTNIESVITTLNKIDIPDADMQDQKFELSEDDKNYLSNFRFGNVTTEEEIRICDLLKHYRDCFSFSMKEIGCVKCVKHRINTGNHNPINQPPYRSSPQERAIIDKTVKEMLDAGIIEPSLSPWASP
ncbi:hypothetical protein B4U79_17151, partial [Dinothrombium tinctorium]